MNRADSTATVENETRWNRSAPGIRHPGDSAADLWLGARVDSDWVDRKLAADYSTEVVQKLKKAVYTIGQGGRRWFSGGEGVSAHQASMILDYLVLIELLLERRPDLGGFHPEFLDCRDQLLMHVSRHTEGQPERAAALVEAIVSRVRRQLTK